MPDERTGSKITWFNSPLRANQDVSTLVNMIQVGQWYGVHKVRGEVIVNHDNTCCLAHSSLFVTEGRPQGKTSANCQVLGRSEGSHAATKTLSGWFCATATS